VPGTYALGVRRTPDQTDSDVTCSRSCDKGKITEMIERKSGMIKTRFFQKKATTYFLNRFFTKKQVFVILLKETTQTQF